MTSIKTRSTLPRIAIIIDSLNGGGAEKVCLTLAKAMKQKDIDIHLIVLKKKCDYDLPKDTNIHFIYADPKKKLYRYFVQKEAAQKLHALVTKLGSFDAHFSNLDECHPIVAKANLPNTYFVIHNSIENILKRTAKLGPLKYWRKWKAFKSLDNKKLVTVSKGVQQEIEQGSRIHPKSITTIYNPFDIDEIREMSKAKESLIPKEPYIIYVGRLAEQKRLDILLEAFKHLKHDVSLVLLGSKSNKMSRIIKRAKLNKKVIQQPFNQNPYPWIKKAKALVLSSDYEGFGMVLVEALACGTPVASTNCPHGPQEILCGPLKRFLAPPQSPRLLARKIDDAINSNMLFDDAEVLNNITADKIVNQYIALARHKSAENYAYQRPITFYLPNYDKIDKIDQLDPFLSWREMPRGEGFWILQTYCLLRHFGVDVKISGELPEDGILVFHRRNKNALFKQPHNKIKKLILVGCRGDLHDLLVPDFELLQNNYFADGERKFAMPHWPMPNIVPRDLGRGNQIKRIAFKGFAAQLHPDFLTHEWTNFLASHNIEWVQNAVDFTHDGKSNFDDSVWADYSDIDLVIAVRPERNNLHTNKPALKLYNAWLAGVPAILGRESAYREVGTSGEDYIEVNSLEDAKNAITYLVEHPNAYQTMIDKGFSKAPFYTHEAVCEAWKHFFYEILPEKIEKRQKQLRYRVSRHIPLTFHYRIMYFWKSITFQRMR